MDDKVSGERIEVMALSGGAREKPLSELKLESKVAAKTVLDKQKELDKAIKDFSKAPALPEKTSKRYEDFFGREREKKAFRGVAIIIALLIIITLFFQPSIFFFSDQGQIKLQNLSGREVTNVAVYNFKDLGDFLAGKAIPVTSKATLTSKETLLVNPTENTILFAVADRQMIAVIGAKGP